ncbi:MAG: glycosyltransferase [Candidatus Omnitrophota bacterium]
MSEKKVFLVHASAGSGHKRAAEALARKLQDEGYLNEVFDVADDMPVLFKWLYTKGYLLLIIYLPFVWGLLYRFTDMPCLSLLNVHLRRFSNAFMCRRFIKRLLIQKPRTVISTHFLTSELVSYVKVKYKLKIQLITVITDFGVHNFWINALTDVYCCASEKTRQILISKKIDAAHLAVTGIPLQQSFLKALDRPELIVEFGLKANTFTILIVTGGIGVGPIEEIVEVLKDEEVQILVVCGRNKKLYKKLLEKKYSNVRLFGFVDFIERLMKMADCIITKAGGLSVTESLHMNLPMIFFFLLPGQEWINAKTIEALEAGVIATSLIDIKHTVLKLKDDLKYRARLRNNTLLLAKPTACQDIISFID